MHFSISILTISDEHCDHTYSIASSIAYKQTHDLTKYSDNLLLKTQLSATVIKTGEFTMKIVKNIPAVIPETPNPIGSESISLINNPLSHRTAFLETETSNIMHTRSKTKNSRLIHVIQPSDFCVNCNQDLCSSMGNAVFCLKTGNVTVTCSTCSSTMSVKGAFKLPKSI